MVLDYTSFYISAGSYGRLLRYDVIAMDYESYLVKVFDEKDDADSQQKALIKIDEFILRRSDFNREFEKNGFEISFKYNRAPSFESYLYVSCQIHRERIESSTAKVFPKKKITKLIKRKPMPKMLGEQSVSLLINYLDVTTRLQKKIESFQNEQDHDVKIVDIWERLNESEKNELLAAIRIFTGQPDSDENEV